MEAENFCGSRLVPTGLGKCIQDELLFEFADGFIEVNAFLNHLRNKRFQLLFHDPPAEDVLLSMFAPPLLHGAVPHQESGLEIKRRHNGDHS
jgi:hypothetical protein